MTRVTVSKEAANFFRSEAAYLRSRNPHAAQSFSETIRRAKDVLRTFADAGNVTHGLQIDGGLKAPEGCQFCYRSPLRWLVGLRPLTETGPLKVVTIVSGPSLKGGGSFSTMMNCACDDCRSRYS